MKAIKVIDIEISTGEAPVNLPPMSEREIAGLKNSTGTQLITLWHKGQSNMYNEGLSRTRNCATLETYALQAAGVVQGLTFPLINGVEVSEIEGYQAAVTRPEAGDWSLIFAGQPRDTGSPGTNYGIFGHVSSAGKNFINPPNLNVTQSGALRVSRTSENAAADWLINYDALGSTLFTVPHIVVVTQSVANGLSLRVDGVQVATNVTANAKLPSTGLTHNLFQSGLGSAVFKGKEGEVMLISDDLTKSPSNLAMFEAHLKSKYAIA